MDAFRNTGHEEYIYSCDEKMATDSFDSCESIGCIKGNAVVLFACREFFTCLCLALFPISRHVGNFLLYDKIGHRNHKKDENHLNKHAMHLVRLLMTVIDILEKHTIITCRQEEKQKMFQSISAILKYSGNGLKCHTVCCSETHLGNVCIINKGIFRSVEQFSSGIMDVLTA